MAFSAAGVKTGLGFVTTEVGKPHQVLPRGGLGLPQPRGGAQRHLPEEHPDPDPCFSVPPNQRRQSPHRPAQPQAGGAGPTDLVSTRRAGTGLQRLDFGVQKPLPVHPLSRIPGEHETLLERLSGGFGELMDLARRWCLGGSPAIGLHPDLDMIYCMGGPRVGPGGGESGLVE